MTAGNSGFTAMAVDSDNFLALIMPTAGGSSGACAACVGDVKPAFRTDDHDNDSTDGFWWILLDGRTIGDASSGAGWADADAQDLFVFLWNHCSNAVCPVSSGRGANAAADWAAHKTLTIPNPTDAGEASPVACALIAAGGDAALAVGAISGASVHEHTGPSHVHDMTHGHEATLSIAEAAEEDYTGLDLSHTTVPVAGDPMDINVLYDTDGEGGTTHDIGTHGHGGSVDVADAETDTAAGGADATSSESSFQPSMAVGFFILAVIP
jgi:hypothetical protein